MNYRKLEMFGREYRRTDSMPADVWVAEDGHVITKRVVDEAYRGTLMGGKDGSPGYYTAGGESVKDGHRTGIRSQRTVSSLVYEAFRGIVLPPGRHMSHVNGDTLDNSLANLRPAPRQDRMVAMIDLETGETLDVFRNVRTAAAAAKVPPAFVRVCLEGRARKAGGYAWRWDDNDPEPEPLVLVEN